MGILMVRKAGSDNLRTIYRRMCTGYSESESVPVYGHLYLTIQANLKSNPYKML